MAFFNRVICIFVLFVIMLQEVSFCICGAWFVAFFDANAGFKLASVLG